MHLRRKRTRPVRAGVVGVGQMGRYHVGVLAELPQVELVGIVDVDPTRIQHLAETYNTSGFTDYRDLLGEV
ncbi:MAG TPA: Gfo/Idh/MocA family oxidoreductase, partial [Candidatus Tectomicrobia bacterium]|nr:Gfo/Idh/MocA family oxidoreductase [Candidatus Tectomicrobia bacterium]